LTVPVAFLTGCSSGIGAAAARAFAAAGYTVWATARRLADLDELVRAGRTRGEDLRPLALDVTDPDSIASAVARATSGGAIDVLVNNAGIAMTGALEDQDWGEFERVMATNFFGPIRLTRAVLPHLRRAGGGAVLMLSSLSALVGLAGESAYAASKAALEAASDALRAEVARFDIRVCVVEPGLYATAMPGKMLTARSGPPGSAYAPLLDHLLARRAGRTGAGADPRELGELLVRLAQAPHLPFRVPAGAQAERVVAALAALEPERRDAFLNEVNDTAWWAAGRPRPDPRT
jgi:NAD(P)-dependent dehydrogenase (short-subunit alcohol dehydrogenase family)